MQKIEVTTTQNVIIEYQFAPVSMRIGAWFIDIIIMLASASILGSFASLAIGSSGFYLVGIPILLFYFLLSELLLDGQTIGKRTTNIKIIKLNGKQPSLGDYLMRWIFSFLDYYITSGVLAFLMIKSTPSHQRLGDLVAGTTVIKMKPDFRFSFQDLMRLQNDGDHVIQYPLVKQCSEAQMLLIKNTIERFKKYPNHANRMTVKKVYDKMVERIPPESQAKRVSDWIGFLEQLIRDYVVLTR